MEAEGDQNSYRRLRERLVGAQTIVTDGFGFKSRRIGHAHACSNPGWQVVRVRALVDLRFQWSPVRKTELKK